MFAMNNLMNTVLTLMIQVEERNVLNKGTDAKANGPKVENGKH